MSFISSIFLWFLPLIAIPLIFHLLKRRKFKNIEFSTLRFFKAIQSEAINRLSVINIILLIIRTLIILFIILMLSRPAIEGKYNSKYSNNNNLVYLIIDDSYSNIETLQNNLNTTISQIHKSYNDDTNFTISLLSDNSIIHDAKLSNEKISFKNLSPSYKSKRLDLNNMYSNIPDKKIYSNIDVYFISDMQSNSIPKITGKDYLFNNDFNLFIIKTNPISQNIYVSDISVKNKLIIPNEIIDINAKIYSSSMDIENLDIELYINNINVGKNTLNVTANNSYDILFKSSIPDNDKYNCKLSINDPSNINIDDDFYFTLEAKAQSEICIISDTNEDYYITKALKSYNQLHKNVSIVHLTSSDYLYNTYGNFDSVILFDYSLLNNSLYSKIDSQTNNIIMIPNVNVSSNTFLTDLLNVNAYKNLESSTLNNNSFISLDTENIKDEHMRSLFDISIMERKVKFFSFLHVPITSNTLIPFDNGYSFLNKFTVNSNSLYIISSPMDLTATNFPIKGIFIPFIGDITKKNNLNNYYTCDQSISLQNEAKFHINPTRDTLFTNENIIYIDDIGFHQIVYSSNEVDYFASNIDKNEFNDSILSIKQIKAIFPYAEIIDINDDFQKVLSKMVVGYEGWRYLLYLVIILIILEMYLSNIYFVKNE